MQGVNTMAESNREWRAESLGPAREVELAQGRLRYHSVGSGPVLVFIHGVLVNANLWRKVVARLSADFRCVSLDLPFGSHLVPMPPAADLSPPAVAELVADAIAALELDDVTLVGNDTGGAIAQIVATRRPERIGRLVLTSCDAFDNFPPKSLRPLKPLLSNATLLGPALAPARAGIVQRGIFKTLAKRPVEAEVLDSYALPAITNAGVRRDLARFFGELHPRHTLDAAERLPGFDRPALVAWSREDLFFPRSHGERLARLLPQGRLEWIDDARTFSPEDQPGRVAELVASLGAAVAPGAEESFSAGGAAR
jgi:pimeloyl-ACP methyl ester carboxylesterase